MGASLDGSSAASPWTPEATERLANIPEFARPMAKAGIEKFAKDRGLAQIDVEVLEQAKNFFGM
ncbi:MAG: protochlorophyllide oxidoreductase [Deltaproteobacteria bacterium]|nr:MAG: protochlorophyllide oxidoreductase [Deltaproteobacteria bacterium]